jgi:hypothetical protein
MFFIKSFNPDWFASDIRLQYFSHLYVAVLGCVEKSLRCLLVQAILTGLLGTRTLDVDVATQLAVTVLFSRAYLSLSDSSK